MPPTDTDHPTQDDCSTRAPIPPEYRSSSPARLQDCVRRYRGTLPADVEQALLDAAHELEASEEAFAAARGAPGARPARRTTRYGRKSATSGNPA
ncbi:hypothetical protein C2U71_22180 [Burkholderia ubonensis]|nr:hypothetical protein C2U71_22180 [Burkholderia ubonensis]